MSRAASGDVESVRRMLKAVAAEADVRPCLVEAGRDLAGGRPFVSLGGRSLGEGRRGWLSRRARGSGFALREY